MGRAFEDGGGMTSTKWKKEASFQHSERADKKLIWPIRGNRSRFFIEDMLVIANVGKESQP